MRRMNLLLAALAVTTHIQAQEDPTGDTLNCRTSLLCNVPANARLMLLGKETSARGTRRQFATRKLARGTSVDAYSVRVELPLPGTRTLVLNKEVTLQACDRNQFTATFVSGPYRSGNLAVYFIHSDEGDGRQYLTLREGVEQGLVNITMGQDAAHISVDNTSDKHLFVSGGERLTGGAHLAIQTSVVLPPKSGPQQVAVAVTGESATPNEPLACSASKAFALNDVRWANKFVSRDCAQHAEFVSWNIDVAHRRLEQKWDGQTALNRLQDSDDSTTMTKRYLAELYADKELNSTVIGFAFAVNGRIREANIYPASHLVTQLYHSMLESYAMEAIIQAKRNPIEAISMPPGASDVLALLQFPGDRATADRDEAVPIGQTDSKNRLVVFTERDYDPLDGTSVRHCRTIYKDDQTEVAVHLQWVRAYRSGRALAVGMHNLKQVWFGIQDYVEANSTTDGQYTLPAPANYDRTGTPLLSWRVHILPFLRGTAEEKQQYKALYDQFSLDERWDSENNRPLIAQMPKIFNHPQGRPVAQGHTCYLLPLGTKTLFPAGNAENVGQGLTVDSATKNRTTIWLLEAAPVNAVPWTKPADWVYDANVPKSRLLSGLIGHRLAGVLVHTQARCELLPSTIPNATLRSLLTRDEESGVLYIP